ncbi:putative holin [Serratia microhaemolytica]|uniref:putative holin n=1 Tax=Serratia microhaemolytica TaxID=2675110 RepID=UPI000FDEEE67|nr:putative holin [Serratia microhaemolytica]
MTEPVTTATAAAGGTVTGVAVVTFFIGLPADVVLGAFAGAILFVVSASDYRLRARLALALGSFVAGITMYKPAAAWIISFLPEGYNRGADAAGALIAAGVIIRLLMMFNSGNLSILNSKKKEGSDDL